MLRILHRATGKYLSAAPAITHVDPVELILRKHSSNWILLVSHLDILNVQSYLRQDLLQVVSVCVDSTPCENSERLLAERCLRAGCRNSCECGNESSACR